MSDLGSCLLHQPQCKKHLQPATLRRRAAARSIISSADMCLTAKLQREICLLLPNQRPLLDRCSFSLCGNLVFWSRVQIVQ